MRRLLIVDDERTARKALVFVVRSLEVQVDEAESGQEARRLLEQNGYDLIVIDLRLPSEEEGLELIRAVHQGEPRTPILVMTAYGTLDSAVKAMKAGAEDYITKDCAGEEILLKISKMLETRQLWLDNIRLSEQIDHLQKQFDQFPRHNPIIGESALMQQVLNIIGRVGQDNETTVLITGESGTGKELVARAIHRNSPARASRPFVVVDVANMPATLLESQLFGHEKGAFTNANDQHLGLVEMANGGSLFLDEIGDFPLELQIKLLRFLQEKTFSRVGGNKPLFADVRIIAATNKTLEEMVQKNRFREDLYYRLNVVRIHLPPLRERREDIPALIAYFVEKFSLQKGRTLSFTAAVISEMSAREWPGNIRQLENFIERLFVICPHHEVRPEDLQGFEAIPSKNNLINLNQVLKLPYKQARAKVLREFESALLTHYLQRCNGNISRLAAELGLSREGLSKKIKRLGLKAHPKQRL